MLASNNVSTGPARSGLDSDPLAFDLRVSRILIAVARHGVSDLHAMSRQAQSTAADDEKAARAGTPAKFPTPDILPRNKWHHEIAKMIYLRDKKTQPRGDLSNVELSPDMAAALCGLEANAPERLEAPKAWPAVAESTLKFASYGLSVPDAPDNPAVSNVQLADFDGDGKLDLIVRRYQGTVFWGISIHKAR